MLCFGVEGEHIDHVICAGRQGGFVGATCSGNFLSRQVGRIYCVCVLSFGSFAEAQEGGHAFNEGDASGRMREGCSSVGNRGEEEGRFVQRVGKGENK